MFCRNQFHHRQLTRVIALCALLLIVAFKAGTPRSHASGKRQSLSFEDRVAAQRAIEAVYWQHRLWPKENPQPKPTLDEVLPDEALHAKVEDSLRQSTALEVYWQRPITAAQLQAEVERMARNTKQPKVLRELWTALGNDSLLIAECLARPALAERLVRERYAFDERQHGALQRRAAAELSAPDAFARRQSFSSEYRETEWQLADSTDTRPIAAGPQRLDAEQWRAQMDKLQRLFARSTGFSRNESLTELPPAGGTTNVAPLPLRQLSLLQEDEERFYALVVLEQTAARVRVGSVEWRKVTFDEWWGRAKAEMAMDVAAASDEYRLPEIEAQPGSCFTDGWTATSTTGAPEERTGHTAMWTGSEMIIWGGDTGSFAFILVNTGGRYNPAINSWTSTSTTSAPTRRYNHTAVWTGSVMIIWGGSGDNTAIGGRYNPMADTWAMTNSTGAPAGRSRHTAVWTGSEMIIWGGEGLPCVLGCTAYNTGGRYNPVADTWTSTNATGAPGARKGHTAVWTGSEM